MTGRVLVVGSLNLDSTLRVVRLPEPGETVHSEQTLRSPGGKGANQAVAAALLGGRVGLIGAVGDDDAGRLLAAAAREVGVDVSAVRVAHGPTGQATIIVDCDAENVIVVDGGANATIDPQHVRDALDIADGGDVVVTGNELADVVVVAAAERAAAVGALLVHNPSPFRQFPGQMPHPGVLVMNQHEFALCGGAINDHPSSSDLPLGLRGGVVVVTRGARGVLVFGPEEVRSVAAVPVSAVDTSGCGDAFLGALAERLAAGYSVVEAAERAVQVGAYAATQSGTQSSYPTAATLAAWSGLQGA